MTFEGEHKVIPIRGIERAGADNLCQDGAMNEVIGLEYKDGSYVPYAATEATKASLSSLYSSGVKFIRIHKTSLQQNIIVVDGAGNVKWMPLASFNSNTGSWSAIQSLSGVSDITIIGDTITIIGDVPLCVYIFKSVDGTLTYIKHEDVDSIGEENVNIRVIPGISNPELNTLLSEGEEYGGYTMISQYLLSNSNNSAIISSYTSVFDDIKSTIGTCDKYGGISGVVLVVACYRKKSGEFAAFSPMYILGHPISKYGEGNVNEITYDYRNVGSRKIVYTKDEIDWQHGVVVFQGDNTCPIVAAADITGSAPYYEASAPTPTSVHSGDSEFKPFKTRIDILGSLANQAYYIKQENDSNHLFSGFSDSKYGPRMFRTTGRMDSSPTEGETRTTVHTNKLQIKISSTDGIGDDISSVCIFMSEQVYPEYIDLGDHYDAASEEIGSVRCASGFANVNSGRYQTFIPRYKDAKAFMEEIRDISNMYLVYEKDIQDIESSELGNWIDVDLSGKLGDGLANLEALPISQIHSQQYLYKHGHVDSYNGRIHLYDFEQKERGTMMFRSIFCFDDADDSIFPSNWWLDSQDNAITPNSAVYEVDVFSQKDDGTNEVTVYTGEVPSLNGTVRMPLNVRPIIYNQFKKAFKIIVRIGYQYYGTYRIKYREFELKQDNTLNITYFANQDFVPNVLTEYQESQTFPIMSSTDIWSIRDNIIKVSDTNNPDYFNAANTYAIGNKKILKTARLAVSLSQDSFGAWPLVVFCEDGIYAMQVDTSGQGVYSSIAPVSREVCTNVNSICEVDGSVLFATDKGLMLLSGNVNNANITHVGKEINGEPKHMPRTDENLGKGMKAYGLVIKTLGAIQIWEDGTNIGAISNSDFKDYINNQNTYISYVSVKNKILVYNKSFSYVYWIDLETWIATKLYMTISIGDGNYPVERYYNITSNTKEFTFNFESGSRGSTPVSCMFQTRPISIKSGLKTSYRVALRGFFKNNLSYIVGSTTKHYFAELLILGSLDSVHWTTIGYKEKSLYGGFHDFGANTTRVSYNYLMVVFSGYLQPNLTQASDEQEGSHIDVIEMTIDNKYNNKLK